jgi:hypothetical protein
MDTINETFLEFKALFGDKKAKAKLELLKTERELQRLERVYEEAGMIDKFKMRKELAYARERYEKAVQQYAIAEGKVTTSASSRIPTTPGTVATETAESGNVIDRLKDLGNDLKDRVIGNDDGTVATSPTIVNNGENATVTALKAQVDAAFRRYMNALNTPNVDKTNLRNLKKEYQKLNKQLFETMN